MLRQNLPQGQGSPSTINNWPKIRTLEQALARFPDPTLPSCERLCALGESMRMNWLGAAVLVLTAMAIATPGQTWRQVGPPGGTVMSLGADPHDANRLYL